MNPTPIPRPIRERLCERDRHFIAHHIFGGHGFQTEEAILTLLVDPATRDLVLDDPDLRRAVLELPSPLSISPELYFYLLVRHSLEQHGIDDRALADYLAGMLAGAVSGEQQDPRTRDLTYHVDFLRLLEDAHGPERFFLHVGCANRFLLLTGIFPDFVLERERRRGAPGIEYYEAIARHSFERASHHPLADEFGLTEVYDSLVQCLPTARNALDQMGRDYLFLSA